MKKSFIIWSIVIIIWIVIAFKVGRENGENRVQEAGVFNMETNSFPGTDIETIYHNGRTYDIFTRFNTTHFEVIRVD